jgi:26S proteasome regulatory subunit N9
MAAVAVLEEQMAQYPELRDQYAGLASLYQQKLWHQLTIALEAFVALPQFEVCPLIWSRLLVPNFSA